jgi:hypothetical protein
MLDFMHTPSINKQDLTNLLKENVLQVTFTKKDGTERVMTCTLLKDIVPKYEKKTEKVKKINENVLSVWDIEKDSFRSFKADSIISYQVLEEGYEL